MDSNHINLYNELIILLLGRYGVFHAEVNGSEWGVGGGGVRGTGKERDDHREQNGTGNGKREGTARARRQRGEEGEKAMLVGDVQEYWGFYEGREPIRFGTYNICNRWNGGLESDSRGISQANM